LSSSSKLIVRNSAFRLLECKLKVLRKGNEAVCAAMARFENDIKSKTLGLRPRRPYVPTCAACDMIPFRVDADRFKPSILRRLFLLEEEYDDFLPIG
jgi:hypothetical protein